MLLLDEAHLIMSQPHVRQQLVRHRQDVAQRVNLKLVEGLVDRGFQQRLQLMHAVLDLGPRGLLVVLVLELVAVAVGVGDVVEALGRGGGGLLGALSRGAEAEDGGRGGEESGLDGLEGLVDNRVDGVDYVVY